MHHYSGVSVQIFRCLCRCGSRYSRFVLLLSLSLSLSLICVCVCVCVCVRVFMALEFGRSTRRRGRSDREQTQIPKEHINMQCKKSVYVLWFLYWLSVFSFLRLKFDFLGITYKNPSCARVRITLPRKAASCEVRSL